MLSSVSMQLRSTIWRQSRAAINMNPEMIQTANRLFSSSERPSVDDNFFGEKSPLRIAGKSKVIIHTHGRGDREIIGAEMFQTRIKWLHLPRAFLTRERWEMVLIDKLNHISMSLFMGDRPPEVMDFKKFSHIAHHAIKEGHFIQPKSGSVHYLFKGERRTSLFEELFLHIFAAVSSRDYETFYNVFRFLMKLNACYSPFLGDEKAARIFISKLKTLHYMGMDLNDPTLTKWANASYKFRILSESLDEVKSTIEEEKIKKIGDIASYCIIGASLVFGLLLYTRNSTKKPFPNDTYNHSSLDAKIDPINP